MRKFLLAILTLIFIMNIQNVFAASNYTLKEYDVETKDGHIIKAYLTYPKTKLKAYPTIVMLHSLGYQSLYWTSLQEKFNKDGYAVLKVDFRGHGKSVYNKNFYKRSWRTFKTPTYQKFPDDIIEVIAYVKKQTRKASFNNWAIVGADIGANTAVLVTKKSNPKPKALVLISPSMTFKGLYIPVAMTEIGYTPILAISSKNDKYSMKEQYKLSKFAQGTFDIYNTPTGGTGMLTLKSNPSTEIMIVNWIRQYFKTNLTTKK